MTTSAAPHKNLELIYRLRALSMAGAVLHIGAHPDDEDGGMMAYLTRKLGVRVVYWSATRGEGGQNRIGPYQGAALGVYRSWESLAARQVDGGEALFGPFIDFGFAKEAAKPLERWGQQEVVREIVRAIRLVQPQIVIARWTGGASDGHGHHKAIGLATLEAFDAAGDPEKFPELQVQRLVAWQPQKLYHSTEGDWQPGEDGVFGKINPELERLGAVRINAGEFDPIAGRTYQAQALIGVNSHQTQAMGFTPDSDDYYYYYKLSTSLAPPTTKENSLHDGLDPTLTGLAHYPGNGSQSLRASLANIKAKVAEAFEKFRPDDPLDSGTALLEGLQHLRELQADLARYDLNNQARQALDVYLQRKIADFESTAAQCLGLMLECLTDETRITPGRAFRLSARLWNHRNIPLSDVKFIPQLPADWAARPVEPNKATTPDDSLQASYQITAAPTAELTCPYWLREPAGLYHYNSPMGEPAGRAFGPAPVQLACEVRLGANGHAISLREPAVLREGFPGGFRELPTVVIPPVLLTPKTQLELLATQAESQQLHLQAVAQSNMEHSGLEGYLALEVPPGWEVEPKQVRLSFSKMGDVQSLRFTVTVPGEAPAGNYPLRYRVHVDGRDYDQVLEAVLMGAPGLPRPPDEMTCIKEAFIPSPAVVEVRLLEVRFAAGLKYAYVEGAADKIFDSLPHFQLDLQLITDEAMGFLDLGQFDTIVIGPNAFLVRDELRKNAGRFLNYVAEGGTLVVQYQGYGHQGKGFTPYPFQYHQPHDRVTYEDAPVTILKPDHSIFNLPNEIVLADWEGWVMNRGMYFFGEWDDRYQPLLACNDPGEDPKQGGMLAASHGRGTYVYTAYSFYRQLPAGIAGAWRLFANLLAIPLARIRERVALLRDVSLFSFMTDAQLEEAARLMYARHEARGAYLCRQGEAGDEMYIITQGEVEVIREESGEERVVRRRTQGPVGEFAVLASAPRSATLRTANEVHLLVIKGADFRALMHRHPQVAERVIEVLVGKLTSALG